MTLRSAAAGRPRRRRPGRWSAALATAFGAVVVPASAAHADPARPGDVWSEVVSVVPATAPVSAEVVGGDAFLRLRVTSGHQATVFDYDTPRQPYLRFMADGTVQENVHSRAHFQNASRYSADSGPQLLGQPEWVTVAHGGEYAWHDHRIHFMARSRPPVTQWQLDLTVDGRPVAIAGFWGPTSSPSPIPWLILAAGSGAWALVVTLLATRAGAATSSAVALAALPIAVSLGRLPAAGGLLRTGGLVVTALVLGLGALAVRTRLVATALLAGSGIALVVWALRRFDVLTHAVLITSMPTWWDRGAVALALGVGLAVAGASVRSLVAQPPGDAVRHRRQRPASAK